MREIILMAHISLDGFVANPKGELDWFEAGEENLEFVGSLTENADAALFGRISYELLNNYWPTAKDQPDATKDAVRYSNWYNNAQKIVVSETMLRQSDKNLMIIGGDVINEIIKIKKTTGKNIIIFGSATVAQLLMQNSLIDAYWIFINPIIFGQGIPLFAGLKNRMNLKFVSSKTFSNGEIALQYTANQ